MSKKEANVSQAGLPMPAVAKAFMGALEEWKGKKQDEPRGSNCLGMVPIMRIKLGNRQIRK